MLIVANIKIFFVFIHFLLLNLLFFISFVHWSILPVVKVSSIIYTEMNGLFVRIFAKKSEFFYILFFYSIIIAPFPYFVKRDFYGATLRFPPKI